VRSPAVTVLLPGVGKRVTAWERVGQRLRVSAAASSAVPHLRSAADQVANGMAVTGATFPNAPVSTVPNGSW